MKNPEVAHLWANKARSEAIGSHFSFSGDTIFSYGYFVIARHYKGAVLFTTHGYSDTTSAHKNLALEACRHLPTFFVDNPTRKPGRRDLRNYHKEINRLIEQARRARVDTRIKELQAKIAEANAFAKHFGFPDRFVLPKKTLCQLQERVTECARRAVEVNQEQIDKWLAGAVARLPKTVGKVFLRVRDINNEDKTEPCDYRTLETSNGALVPLAEAERAFRFAVAVRKKGWHRNGESVRVGNYEFVKVDNSEIVVGCTHIEWSEAERFAKTQGWV